MQHDDHSASRRLEVLRDEAPHLLVDDTNAASAAAQLILEETEHLLDEYPHAPAETRDRIGRIRRVARTLLGTVAVMAALAAGANAAHNYVAGRWSAPVTRWHLATAPHTTFVALRQVGSPYSTPDDTKPVRLVDGLGNPESTRTAPWKLIKVPVPAQAKVARISIRAAITRGRQDGDAVVYAFARTPGATCCAGPPGYPQQPVDYSLKGQALDGSDNKRPPMVVQADATGPGGSYRGWSTFDIPLRHGRFALAWGYRKASPDWPQGDAVGLLVYVDGWAS